MITMNAFTPYRTGIAQLKSNQMKQLNKNISFGELDYGGADYYVSSRRDNSQRDNIDEKYDKKLSNLADIADDIDMDNSVYYAQKARIESERNREISNYKDL